MKYLYGESANTIKSRIGVMLIAATYGDEKGTDMFLEFLRICNHDTDYAYICELLQSA